MRFFVLLIVPLLLARCAVVTVHTQQAQFQSATHQPAIHITPKDTSGALILRPHISVKTKTDIRLTSENHTSVNSYGEFEVEAVAGETYYHEVKDANRYEFKGKDVQLLTATTQIGMELEMRSESGAIFGSVQHTTGGLRAWSAQAGLGYMVRFTSWAWRTDLACQWQRSFYDVEYLTRTEFSSRDNIKVSFFRQEGQQTQLDLALSFTFNSIREDWPINVFGSINLGNHTLVTLPDKSSVEEMADYEYGEGLSQGAFGVYGTLLPRSRVLAGLRYNHFDDKFNGSGFWDLIIQWDMEL